MTRKALNLAANTPDAERSPTVRNHETPLTLYALTDELQLTSIEPIACSRHHIARSIAMRERAALVQQTSQALVEQARKLSEHAIKLTG